MGDLKIENPPQSPFAKGGECEQLNALSAVLMPQSTTEN
jgi:hypothetical protein